MLRVGTKVKAKYLATSAGVRCPGDWFTGKIAKVNQDGTYNVVYDDGDRENAVLARYIKADGASADGEAANKRPAEHPPPEAEGSRRRGKRPAVEQEQPVVVSLVLLQLSTGIVLFQSFHLHYCFLLI